VAVAAVLLVPGVARADGDPASDYLVVQDVFFPFDVKVPAAEAGRFSQLVADATKRGFRVKVALIAGPGDLGSVTALWRKPQQYAEFLGQELYYVYRGPLLIAMPNGYGISQRGKPLAAARALLDREPLPGRDLAGAATSAVRKLAAARGIDVPVPAAASGSGENRDRLVIAGIAAAVAALAAAVAVLRRRRRPRTYP